MSKKSTIQNSSPYNSFMSSRPKTQILDKKIDFLQKLLDQCKQKRQDITDLIEKSSHQSRFNSPQQKKRSNFIFNSPGNQRTCIYAQKLDSSSKKKSVCQVKSAEKQESKYLLLKSQEKNKSYMDSAKKQKNKSISDRSSQKLNMLDNQKQNNIVYLTNRKNHRNQTQLNLDLKKQSGQKNSQSHQKNGSLSKPKQGNQQYHNTIQKIISTNYTKNKNQQKSEYINLKKKKNSTLIKKKTNENINSGSKLKNSCLNYSVRFSQNADNIRKLQNSTDRSFNKSEFNDNSVQKINNYEQKKNKNSLFNKINQSYQKENTKQSKITDEKKAYLSYVLDDNGNRVKVKNNESINKDGKIQIQELKNKINSLESKIQDFKKFCSKKEDNKEIKKTDSKKGIQVNLKQQIQLFFQQKDQQANKDDINIKFEQILKGQRQNQQKQDQNKQNNDKKKDIKFKVINASMNIKQKKVENNSNSNLSNLNTQQTNNQEQVQSAYKNSCNNVNFYLDLLRNQQKINNLYYISKVIKSFQLKTDVDVQEHFMQVFSALCFVKEIKQPSQTLLQQKKLNIVKSQSNQNKKTLVFDLDETLIHCNEAKNQADNVILPIRYETGEILDAGISIRPHAREILKEMSKIFEIIIFTASQSCYADVILDYLDPKGKYISHRLYRESCIQTEQGIYVKDLRVLNRELSEIVIVDNAAYSFAFQIDNGIPIISYYDDKNDTELLDLMEYLKYLNNYEDLAQANRKQLKLQQFQDFDNPNTLFQSLYSNYINNQSNQQI